MEQPKVQCIKAISAAFLGAAIVFLSLPVQTKPNPHVAPPKITVARAQTVTLKRYPGVIVGRTVLENEEGHWQYSVNVRSGKKLREVMVDAYSGRIASVEVTTHAEEAREAQDEAKKKAHTQRKKARIEKAEINRKRDNKFVFLYSTGFHHTS